MNDNIQLVISSHLANFFKHTVDSSHAADEAPGDDQFLPAAGLVLNFQILHKAPVTARVDLDIPNVLFGDD